MKRLLGLAAVAASVLAGLGARSALSSTSVGGIPADCQMKVSRAKIDAKGERSGDPTTFLDVSMVGNWTARAFRRSWDGRIVLSHTFSGFKVTKGAESSDYKVQFLHRNFWWAPDSKRFMIWLPAGIAVLNSDDLGTPGEGAKYKIVYRPPAGHFPFGVAWAPTGTDILLSEHVEEKGVTKTALMRINAEGGGATAIVQHESELVFYMPPDTWFEDGSGPKAKKFPIVFGAKDGLWVVDGDGGGKQKLLEQFPSQGLADVMWDPTGKERFLVLFRLQFAQDDGKKTWKGLYLDNADELRKKKDNEAAIEQISDDVDVHSLFFSPKGKYVGWANSHGVSYRETNAKGGAPVKVELTGGGEVHGFTWADDEKHLAVAAANHLFTYDLAAKSALQVVEVDRAAFIAEPFWRGDEIVYSSFIDILEKRRIDQVREQDEKARKEQEEKEKNGGK